MIRSWLATSVAFRRAGLSYNLRRSWGTGGIVVGLLLWGLTGSACTNRVNPASPRALADAGTSLVISPFGLSIRWLPPTITRWRKEIEAAAHEHEVSADLLALMMLVESRGDPNALSRAGALGLMQIMPSTARHIASNRGMKDFNPRVLVDPAINLDFAAWYMQRMLRYFEPKSRDADETMMLAISAYNAGPGTVNAFIRGSRLPPQTRSYRKTFSALWADRGAASSATMERMDPTHRPLDIELDLEYGRAAAK